MGNLLFPAPELRTIPVRGSHGSVPVHRIFCVGRNYAEHALEMGVEIDREAPFYFTKSPTTLERSGQVLPYPSGTSNFHYEMELVAVIGRAVFNVRPENSLPAIFGYAAGLDMTRRDLQLAARAKQRPWDLGKDVEHSSIVGPITRSEEFGKIGPQRIVLTWNGVVKQQAHLCDLIWKVEELVSHLSRFYHLVPGDLIYTGTPAGVGAAWPGDLIEGTIDGLDPVHLEIGVPA